MKTIILTIALIICIGVMMITFLDLYDVVFKGEPLDWPVLVAFVLAATTMVLIGWLTVREEKKE